MPVPPHPSHPSPMFASQAPAMSGNKMQSNKCNSIHTFKSLGLYRLNPINVMSKLDKMSTNSSEERAAYISTIPATSTIIGSNFVWPVGVHQLLVSDKDAFGFLTVERKATDKAPAQTFVLPIVAGTVTLEDGGEITTEVSDRNGARTLVIPLDAFKKMQANGDYDITVSEVNGRNYVTAVSAIEVAEPVIAAPKGSA
jgi:hypothetical protein